MFTVYIDHAACVYISVECIDSDTTNNLVYLHTAVFEYTLAHKALVLVEANTRL